MYLSVQVLEQTEHHAKLLAAIAKALVTGKTVLNKYGNGKDSSQM